LRNAGRLLLAFARRAAREETYHWWGTLLGLAGFALGLGSQALLGRFVDTGSNPQLGAYAGRYAAFLIVGVALLDLQGTVVASLSSRIRDAQHTGAFETLLVTPAPTALILAGITFPDLLWALVRVACYAAVGGAFFGLDLSSINLLGVAALAPLFLASFFALGLVGASITMFLRRADPVNLFVAALSMLAGGVLYPQSVLPAPLRQVGALLPIGPSLDGLRSAVVSGAGPAALTGPLLRLLAFAAGVGPIGALAFSRALLRARREGSLTAF
jgi:ABC-2 type transport system permease protein